MANLSYRQEYLATLIKSCSDCSYAASETLIKEDADALEELEMQIGHVLLAIEQLHSADMISWTRIDDYINGDEIDKSEYTNWEDQWD